MRDAASSHYIKSTGNKTVWLNHISTEMKSRHQNVPEPIGGRSAIRLRQSRGISLHNGLWLHHEARRFSIPHASCCNLSLSPSVWRFFSCLISPNLQRGSFLPCRRENSTQLLTTSEILFWHLSDTFLESTAPSLRLTSLAKHRSITA